MTPPQHARIKEVFLEALQRPDADRASFLDVQCAGDQELRKQVEVLLVHHQEGTVQPLQVLAEQLDAAGSAASVPSKKPPADSLEPGTMVAGRFRIVSELGRGGMGVVYRAEDLTLHQPVALKFLAPRYANQPAWLDRLRNEVRMARKISHPAVCRIHDIAESDGRWFISMEYIDGEDLGALQRRIGRISVGKALEIAREICIGLAAAHAAGVLHRDLKPSNIMLDGKGRVHITDFGLAALPGEVLAGEIRSGTPAFMAPEQISGREVSVQSDVYSLGLVLYQLFAGRLAFSAESAEEYRDLHLQAEAVPISRIVDDVPAGVERIIHRCLAKNPQDRPKSALTVAAALPGVDTLQAALAAGVTPSPDTVAGAVLEAHQPGRAVFMAVMCGTLLAAVVLVRTVSPVPWDRPGGKPPEALLDRAREVVSEAGYSLVGGDDAGGYCTVEKAELFVVGFAQEKTPFLPLPSSQSLPLFWYRRGHDWLIPMAADNLMFGAAQVTPSDPPQLRPGSISLLMDSSGRLLRFAAIDAQTTEIRDSAVIRSDPWESLFKAAHLKRADFVSIPTTLNPVLRVDGCFAWRASPESGQHSGMTVEGCLSSARPSFFAVGSIKSSEEVSPLFMGLSLPRLNSMTLLRWLFLALFWVALPLALSNQRRGSLDRVGALRLAAFTFVLQMLLWFLRAKHVPDWNREMFQFGFACLQSLGLAAMIGIFYVALEPIARRYWPHMLVTWSRLLTGRCWDPLVGRHILIGVGIGCFWALAVACERLLVEALGWNALPPIWEDRSTRILLGGRYAVAACLDVLRVALARGLLLVLLLALLRALFRRPLWAALAVFLVVATLTIPQGTHAATAWLALGVAGGGVAVWAALRFGLVTLSTALFVVVLLNTFPICIQAGVWTNDLTWLALGVVFLIVLYGLTALRMAPSSDS